MHPTPRCTCDACGIRFPRLVSADVLRRTCTCMSLPHSCWSLGRLIWRSRRSVIRPWLGRRCHWRWNFTARTRGRCHSSRSARTRASAWLSKERSLRGRRCWRWRPTSGISGTGSTRITCTTIRGANGTGCSPWWRTGAQTLWRWHSERIRRRVWRQARAGTWRTSQSRSAIRRQSRRACCGFCNEMRISGAERAPVEHTRK
mmetsp:Transcript_4344/g.12309  ORF Transcript_4344/g.12309 Transcript_4344/m.12309 type:complete len:202 (+) Transcript_4344:654-1259(+)